MYINTRVLILTNNVQFSMQTAQALERAGAFKVAPFASIDNALMSLHQSPQEVVLLDTSLAGLNAEAFIVKVREIQPDIAFILLPESVANQQLVTRLNLHGVADVTWTARRLLPLIKAAQRRVYDDQPKTAQVKAATPPKNQDESTRRINALNVPGDDPVEFLLSDASDGETRVDVIGTDDSKAHEVFKILSDEEPPMPSFEESATIHDLRERLVNPAFLKEISGIARDMDDEDDDTPPSSGTGGTFQEDEPSTAALILASSADDSTPLDAFSLEDFLNRIQEKLLESGRTLQPLPSWVQESEKYVREPDFLDDDLPGIISPSTPLEYTSSITTPSKPTPEVPAYNEMETERSQPVVRSYPVSDEEIAAASAELLPPPSTYDTYLGDDEVQTVDLPPEFILDASIEKTEGTTRDLPTASLAAGQTDLPPLDKEHETNRTPTVPLPSAPSAAEGERSYIEQLTVTLVQVSLELTAEATLLIREGQIIAHDGVLPLDDVRELFQLTGQNWEAEPLQGRIRFLTLPASGQDFMLYSRGMETGVTLCLIFAGTLPLYTIRRQGKRLADAMAAVPAPPLAFAGIEEAVVEAVEEELEDIETGELLPFTYLWPVRDESVALWPETREALFDYYQRQLPKRGWDIQAMDIQEDYIYLAVRHPATQSASERLQDLQQRAAAVIERLQDRPTDLWASSYTVLIPGRALTTDEIQDFLEFARS